MAANPNHQPINAQMKSHLKNIAVLTLSLAAATVILRKVTALAVEKNIPVLKSL